MQLLKIHLIYGFLLVFSPAIVSAATVFECIDGAGDTSFRHKCPPGMTVRSTQGLPTDVSGKEPTIEDVLRESPVLLFSAPSCAACDLVREQLEQRSVPFTEKNATEDRDVQVELAGITGGPLTVPTMTIGQQNSTDYSRSDLKSALTDAGYP
jgi:glutaredoxin